MDVKKVRLMRQAMLGVTSLNKPYEENSDDGKTESTLENSIGADDKMHEESNWAEMINVVTKEVESKISRRSMSSTRDIYIYRKRVIPILMRENPQTFECIGAKYGLTRQCIKQREAKIIKRYVRPVLKKLGLSKRYFKA